MLLKLKNKQALFIEQPFIRKNRSFIIKPANNMKRMVLAFYSFVFSFILLAQTYTPIDNGSRVHFVIDNFGIATGGDFTGLTGTIKFDPADPANADFDVSVDANTVNTDITARDNHL